ncbi:HNH endonuclease signature motif containing protein [soil metagenome]
MKELDSLLDPRRADVRVEFGVARAEFAHGQINRSTAEQWGSFDDILTEARRWPELFVDPAVQLRRAERIEFAERAAAADLAVRLGLSEATVRSQAAHAQVLRRRLSQVWSLFCDGEVSVANARCAAELVGSLPDDPDIAARFDAALAEIAVGLAPARFRTRARVLRERIHSLPLIERARQAAETRGAWIDNDIDGMANLTLRLPADVAHIAFQRVDAAARDLVGCADETRTLAQVRADVATDLLIDGGSSRKPPRVTVAVTVPVMTLLGHSDEPGTLEGYGPIDADTARQLAGHAPSFTRLLTHPVTGTLLDIDRATYRPPADLKRWTEVRDVTCTFPGCGRSARSSDLDHTVDFQYGGPTRADNLAHLCRHHHRLKHMTRWRVEIPPEGAVTWTSPTGKTRHADPPPF